MLPDPARIGTLYVIPLALAFAPLHVLARIGIVGILVGAEVEDRVVLFEDVLGAVAVVGVEVDDEHALVPDASGRSARRRRRC